MAEADEIKKTATLEMDHALVENIIIKTQGFVSGNFSEGDSAPVQKFRDLLKLYEGIDKKKLQKNMKYWLEAIMPPANISYSPATSSCQCHHKVSRGRGTSVQEQHHPR